MTALRCGEDHSPSPKYLPGGTSRAVKTADDLRPDHPEYGHYGIELSDPSLAYIRANSRKRR